MLFRSAVAGDRQQYPFIAECYDTGLVSEIQIRNIEEIKTLLVGEKRNYLKNEIFTTIDQFYDNLSQAWYRRREEDIENEEKVVEHDKRKTGRNDPCSCGSGKKYKKCCM